MAEPKTKQVESTTSTNIRRCRCSGTPSANYQDKVYGIGMRIMNLNFKKTEARCTVCGSLSK